MSHKETWFFLKIVLHLSTTFHRQPKYPQNLHMSTPELRVTKGIKNPQVWFWDGHHSGMLFKKVSSLNKEQKLRDVNFNPFENITMKEQHWLECVGTFVSIKSI